MKWFFLSLLNIGWQEKCNHLRHLLSVSTAGSDSYLSHVMLPLGRRENACNEAGVLTDNSYSVLKWLFLKHLLLKPHFLWGRELKISVVYLHCLEVLSACCIDAWAGGMCSCHTNLELLLTELSSYRKGALPEVSAAQAAWGCCNGIFGQNPFVEW